MKKNKHAEEIAARFREMVEGSGDALSEAHCRELALLIEAGIDAALVEVMEGMADRLDALSRELRRSAEFFNGEE